MFRHAPRTAVALLLLASVAAGQSTHVNEEIGYRIRLPDDFQSGTWFSSLAEVLAHLNQHSIDSFYCTDRLRTKDGGTYTERLTTYYFPKRSAAEAAKQGGGELYLSFRDFAQAKIRGFYFASEEELKVAGLRTTVSEMVFEKLAGIPKRYYVCAYEVPTGEFAIVFTCTEEHFKKRRGTYQKTFKSFKMLSPDGLKAPVRSTPTKSSAKPKDGFAKIDLSDAQAVAEATRDVFNNAITQVDGERKWRALEGDHFLVVHATGGNFAKKLSAHADALAASLDERFGGLGDGTPRAAIIIARESGTDALKLEGVPPWMHVYYVLETEDPDPKTRFNRFNEQYIQHWFAQKNSDLWSRLPHWIRTGLPEILDNAHLKGSRIAYDMHESEESGYGWLSERMSEHKKERLSGTPPVVPIQELVGPASIELINGKTSGYVRRQSYALVRFLFDGPGSRNKRTADLIDVYLASCRELAEAQAKEERERRERTEELEKAKETLSDEERLSVEDELYRLKREQSGANADRDLLQETFTRTFGDWTDKDWSSLDKSFRSFLRRAED